MTTRAALIVFVVYLAGTLGASEFTGARDVGVGVILGSNIFNLAALLGVSAVLAVRVAAAPD